jgi:hypothetical protein
VAAGAQSPCEGVFQVDHEGGLLHRKVYTVVVVELALGQEVIPVVLLLTCEYVQIPLAPD